MALRDAIATLRDCWDDVLSGLARADAELLNEAVRGLTADPHDEGLMGAILGLLDRHLPIAHPIREAIKIDLERSPITRVVWADVISDLRRLTERGP